MKADTTTKWGWWGKFWGGKAAKNSAAMCPPKAARHDFSLESNFTTSCFEADY
jgi:hypothetical protein